MFVLPFRFLLSFQLFDPLIQMTRNLLKGRRQSHNQLDTTTPFGFNWLGSPKTS